MMVAYKNGHLIHKRVVLELTPAELNSMSCEAFMNALPTPTEVIDGVDPFTIKYCNALGKFVVYANFRQ